MHTKYSSPVDWNQITEDYVRRVKVSSAGLVGLDRQEFAKVASAELLFKLDRMECKADEYPVHIIALGADEMYGGNRNGDTFDESTCRKMAHTFVSMARPYRDHKHRPEKGDPWFGKIAAAAYNPDMKRIELLILYNATKTAAERNGGQVADREIETLERGKLLPTSMGCLVSRDVCSWCKNAAPSPKDYCTEATCEAGGLKKNMGRYVKVGDTLQHLRAFNPGARFFDHSSVGLNADMIAFGGRADYMSKTAALQTFDDVVKLARANAQREALPPLAPLLVSPAEPEKPLTDRAQTLLKLAYALAVVEQEHELPVAAKLGFQDKPAIEAAKKLASHRTDYGRAQVRRMAAQGTILSLPEYAAWTGRDEACKVAVGVAPQLFSWFVGQTDGAQALVDEDRTLATRGVKLAAHDAGSFGFDASSYDPQRVVARARTRIIAVDSAKVASVKTGFEIPSLATEAHRLAIDYATYKLAAIEAYLGDAGERVDPLFTSACAIGQNCCL